MGEVLAAELGDLPPDLRVRVEGAHISPVWCTGVECVLHRHRDLADERVLGAVLDEGLERRHHRAVGRVLDRQHGAVGGAGAHCAHHVLERGERDQRVVRKRAERGAVRVGPARPQVCDLHVRRRGAAPHLPANQGAAIRQVTREADQRAVREPAKTASISLFAPAVYGRMHAIIHGAPEPTPLSQALLQLLSECLVSPKFSGASGLTRTPRAS